MKAIKMKQQIIYNAIFIGLLMVCLTGCKKIAGLSLQKDTDHETSTLDPHINKTAWQYLRERSNVSPTDTIFKRMYEAIIYSGIDTTLYTQPGNTFIFCITMLFSELLRQLLPIVIGAGIKSVVR